MAISHSKSVTIADFTGTVTVFNSLGATQTANATDLVRPSDWNSVHNQYLTLTGNTNNASTASGSNVVLSGGNGVTLIGSNSVVGISVATNYQSQGAYLTTAMLSNAATISNINVSAGTTSQNLSAIVFSNSNGVSFGLNGSTVTGSHNAITTARASTDAIGLNTALTAGPLAWTVNSSGLSLNASSAAGTTSGFTGANISGSMTHNTAGLALSLSVAPAGAVTLTNYATGNTTQSSSGTIAGSSIIVRGSGGVSAGISNGSYIVEGPALTSLSATGALSASSNGSTISLGVGTVTASATGNTTQASSGTINLNALIFQGTGGASVGISNGSVVISGGTGGGGGGVGLGVSTMGNTAGTTGTVTTGNVALVGSGVISLSQSSSGSNATISILAPATSSLSATGAVSISTNGSTISIGAGQVTMTATGNTTQTSTGGISLHSLHLSGAGNVSVGVSAGSVIISGGTAAAAPVNFSAGTTSGNLGSVVFADSNGVSFGLNGSTITASYTRPVVSNAIQAVGSATGSGTNTSRFAPDDHVHEGVFSVGVSTGGNTSGDTRVGPGRFVLQGGNNVTLSQITAANALNTIVISGGAAGAADGVNALVVNAGASTASTTLTLSNSNNVSFGHNAGVITATATFAQTNQSAIKALGVSNTGQTAGNTGVSTGIDWVLAGSQSITLSQSTAGGGPNTIWVQHPAWITTAMQSNAATISNINLSAGTTSTNASAFTFANSNGITFGLSTGAGAGQITASHNGLTTARASTDAIGLNTALTAGPLAWTVNSSGLSLNAGSAAGTSSGFTGANISASITHNTAGLAMSMSVAAPGAAAVVVSDTATSLSATRIALTNSNNITMTWSTSNNSAVTLIASFSQSNQAGSVYAVGNTSGTSSGTYDARTISISAAGAMTAAASNSGYILSVPATSSLVGTSGISISTNGSTISVFPVVQNVFDNFRENGYISAAGTAIGNSLVSVQLFDVDQPVVFSNMLVPVSFNVASAANNSSAYMDISASAVFYSRNASSLSSVTSVGQTMTQTWSSNATGTVTGVIGVTMTGNAYTLTPGRYWVALHLSTTNSATGGANTTALTHQGSVILAQSVGSAANLLHGWQAGSNQTVGLLHQGVISTGATRASYSFGDITQSGTRAVVAPFAFILRNETYIL